METIEKSVEVLNDLIEINNSRTEGFERAKANLSETDSDLKPIFDEYAQQSRQFSQELNAELTSINHGNENSEMTSGAIHRAWLQVKALFTGHDRKSLLAECERGEDAIKKAYSDALAEGEISANFSSIISRQSQEINMAHARIKMLRDSAA